MVESLLENDGPPASGAVIIAAAARLRAALERPFQAEVAAAALAEACRRLSSTGDADGGATIAAIARRWGWSEPVLELSLRALCEPMKYEALRELARKTRAGREIIGFIMAGNIPGVGLHEVMATLIAGRTAMIKTAASEPVFFHQLAAVLKAIAPELAARMAVFTWAREDASLTSALREACDRIVVFGDDETIRQPLLRVNAASGAGFGARVSGAVMTAAALRGSRRGSVLHPLTFDIIAFEQRGCLSPHHIFIGETGGLVAEDFAASLAAQLEAYAEDALPSPSRLALEDAAAIRRVRERARWRAIGGQAVRLWEGPIPGWTVIYDRDAAFTQAPGFRTVCISPFRDAADLARRLAPVAGRVEAMAFKTEPTIDSKEFIGALREVLERTGATYICEPGRMQSPPIDWFHGGGAFLRRLFETE